MCVSSNTANQVRPSHDSLGKDKNFYPRVSYKIEGKLHLRFDDLVVLVNEHQVAEQFTMCSDL